MTLNEKFYNIINNCQWQSQVITADKCEKLTDDFAIGFVEWKDKISNSDLIYSKKYAKPNEELLKIYKKEKNL